MANFIAEIEARLNSEKFSEQIKGLEKQQINLSVNTEKIVSEIRDALKNNKFDVNVGKVNMSSASSEAQKAGVEAGRKFSDSFRKSTSSSKVAFALDTGSISASIASVTSQYEKLSTTGHSKLQTIKDDITQLASLQKSMIDSSSAETAAVNYDKFNTVLSRVKNGLKEVSADNFINSLDKINVSTEAIHTKSLTLSATITSWMNQNTRAAQEFGDQLRDILATLSTNKDPAMLTKARNEFALIKAQANALGLSINPFTKSLKETALQVFGLSNATMVIRKIIQVAKEGIDTVTELDTALVDLKKTTTMSSSDLASFYKEANESAKELGVTTKDIIQSAADWSRLGFSDKDSATAMSKYAAQFAAISPGVDIDAATTGLVSVIKAYDVETDDVLDGIMSKINIIGNTAATSNEQIIAGLKNSASAMAAMNSTLDENIALFTAAQEIAQDASKVGNALRTISMRIRGYDEETEQLSEDLVNISGEVIDLTKTASNPNGVSLFTDASQTEYKSIYTYLKEISEIYDELSAKNRQQLMEKLFGKMRTNIGQAIINNFSAAEKAMDNMANSAGNADAEMEIITESIEYKMNALKETGTAIFQNIFPQKGIGTAVDGLTSLLGVLEKITSLPGNAGIVGVITALLSATKNIGRDKMFSLHSRDLPIAIIVLPRYREFRYCG